MKDEASRPPEGGSAEGAIESINSKLFAAFDPDEEKQWLVGGSSASVTFSKNPGGGTDKSADVDW